MPKIKTEENKQEAGTLLYCVKGITKKVNYLDDIQHKHENQHHSFMSYNENFSRNSKNLQDAVIVKCYIGQTNRRILARYEEQLNAV